MDAVVATLDSFRVAVENFDSKNAEQLLTALKVSSSEEEEKL